MTNFARTILVIILVHIWPPAQAAEFTVTTIADAGEGSLRATISDANALAGADTITFAIPGPGPHTIRPVTALPQIDDTVTIDGLTQAGADCSAWPPSLQIELAGDQAGSASDGLKTGFGRPPGVVIRGLVINRFGGSGLVLRSDETVECSFIGTDVAGLQVQANDDFGIELDLADGARIGGPQTSQRNLIAGNGFSGIIGSISDNVVVQGNYIGTNVLGDSGLGNANAGIVTLGGSGWVIGGDGPGAGNIVSDNGRAGIAVISQNAFGSISTGFVIENNRVGLSADGMQPLPNGDYGILLDNVRDNLVGPGNHIHADGFAGVLVEGVDENSSFFQPGALSNQITRNLIVGTPPIDLCVGTIESTMICMSEAGPSANDADDADTGANRLQNHPEIQSISGTDGQNLAIEYSVPSSTMNSSYPLRIEFFRTDQDGNPEAYLGSSTYLASDAEQVVEATICAVNSAATGDLIAATATDAENNTSEMSVALEFTGTTASGCGPLFLDGFESN